MAKTYAKINGIAEQMLDASEDVHLAVEGEASFQAKRTVPLLEERIVAELERDGTISRDALRSMLRVNNQRFGQALATLVSSGRIVPTPAGLTLSRS